MLIKVLKFVAVFCVIFVICGCDNRVVSDYAAKETFAETVITPPPVEDKYDDEKLKKAIVEITDKRPENWSVYIQVPGRDFEVEINNKVVTAASTIKLFNMASLYNEIYQGNLVMDDKLKDSLFDMITVSSNDDSNRVVKAIGGGDFDKGAQKVTLFAKSLGLTDTKEEHMLYDVAGPSKGANTTSVKDCGRILKRIYNYQCVCPEYDEEMLELLKQQTRDWKIPSGVPEGIVVANKTGENSKVEFDVGIVFSPECDYIICISVTDFAGLDVFPVFTEISKMTYEFFNGTV